MVKTHTTLSVDGDILKEAKELNINLSAEFESFIKRRVKPSLDDVPKESIILTCGICGKQGEKATKDTHYQGLTWLYPDEILICESCLKTRKINPTGA